MLISSMYCRVLVFLNSSTLLGLVVRNKKMIKEQVSAGRLVVIAYVLAGMKLPRCLVPDVDIFIAQVEL